MCLPELPENGKFQQVKEWLKKFEEAFGYENVANKWTTGNARAFKNYGENDLKVIFGLEGSLIYKSLHNNKVATQNRAREAEPDHHKRKPRPNISTEGPIHPQSTTFMLPFLERDIFEDVLNGFYYGRKSFVIHGPYQSGKTTFLLALEAALREKFDTDIKQFDMTGATGDISINGPQVGFTNFLSYLIFQEYLDSSALYTKLQYWQRRLILLIDEFQFIFRSQDLLYITKAFFNALSFNSRISYVA
ncbi:110_t:CDS:2, partial [Funneliformis geosporum]